MASTSGSSISFTSSSDEEDDVQQGQRPGRGGGAARRGGGGGRGGGSRGGGGGGGGGRGGGGRGRDGAGGAEGAGGADAARSEKMRMARVTMPDKKEYKITVPTPKRCDCRRFSKTTLIPLSPNGDMGAREFKIVSDQMNKTIRQHSIQFSRYKIIKMYKVKNCCLYNKYRNMQRELGKHGPVTERMLFHGTPSFRDIVQTGFDERHSTIDGLFGAGIYFAEHSSKSNQYVFSAVKNNQLFAFLLGVKGCPTHHDHGCTICERKILLCRVSLGKVCTRTAPDKMPHAPPGYNSVKGEPVPGGLKYPEYVIYRGEQAYPEYSITYKIVK